MTCNVKQNTISYFKQNGLITEDFRINSSEFKTENIKHTQVARDKYGILNQGLLFIELPDNKVGVNESLFKELQEKFDLSHEGGQFSQINYNFKVIHKILENLDKVNKWWNQVQSPPVFWEKLQSDLGIPKEQIELLKQSEGNNLEQKLTSFISKYTYAVEINTATEGTDFYGAEDFQIGSTRYYTITGEKFYKIENNYANNFNRYPLEIDFKEFERAAKQYKDINEEPTQYYSNLSAPGGTNYTENEISTPLITPSIKGHAQFSTDKGIGWFRSDDRKFTEEIEFEELENNEDETSGKIVKSYPEISGPKTRRILEVQSDLFQKGRNSTVLVSNPAKQKEWNYFTSSNGEKYSILYKEENGEIRFRFYDGTSSKLIAKEDLPQDVIDFATKERKRLDNLKTVSENQFLQLLNKDNNWVTFFVRAIIQSTAKERIYEASLPDIEEKVLSLQKEGKLKIDCK